MLVFWLLSVSGKYDSSKYAYILKAPDDERSDFGSYFSMKVDNIDLDFNSTSTTFRPYVIKVS